MKYLVTLVAFLMLQQAQAQSQDYQYAQPVVAQPVVVQPQAAPQPLTQKRTVIYDERTNELVEVQPQVAESQPFGAYNSGIQSTIQPQLVQQTIVRPVQSAPAVQNAPVSLVQDSPLAVSKAEQMRKSRQESEVKTEQVIVEKLETDRIKEEENRRNRIVGVIEGASNNKEAAPAPVVQQVQPAPAPIQQQVVVPAPIAAPVVVAPAPIVKEEKEEKVDIKAEIRSALDEHSKKKADPASYYLAGLVGLGKYPDIVNVRGNISSGVAIGVVTPERVVVEGAFHYGTYDLEDVTTSGSWYPRIVDMRQYNLSAALKYQLLPGRIRPNVGGVVGYTRRSMSEYGYDFRTSDAFDVGFATGLDLQLTDVFAVGLDFRYMTNVTYREKTDYQQSFVYRRNDNPIEKLDYYIGTLSGKFTF